VPVLGFCFSFPVEQTSVNSGKLLRWTKGYNNPGAEGKDPAKLLAEAFKRKVLRTLSTWPAFHRAMKLRTDSCLVWRGCSEVGQAAGVCD
jgi:hypothetical protein